MSVLVPAPVRKPRQGGIKSVAGDYVNVPRLNAPEGDPAWEDATCGFPNATWAECTKPADAEAKEGDGVEQHSVVVPPFAQYKGVECYLGGDSDGPSFAQQATDGLAFGDERMVEDKLFDWATAVGTGTATTLTDGIALAEQASDEVYVGQPVILLSRGDADRAFADGVIVRENGKLVTGNGSPVLASGEFTSGTVAAVGAIAVYATPVMVRQADDLPHNRSLAIAERVYAVGVDCEWRYKVTVQPTP